ncbi:MAG: DUF87 domain-containing protein [Veillonellales bacterium]
MFDRNIGRVVSVDSFRIIIELEKDIKTLYKSGYQDIYEIARINSYIILPVGADKIVALITKVKINDETEIEATTGAISLPKARRFIVATMIGTIDGSGKFLQGVYNFPILDNPVWYVMKEDLELIFDQRFKGENIDFKKDYFLSIGTSPVFSGFKIKINPDKFFSKHAAILGNTGSGKSCTISTIFQSIFQGSYKSDGVEKKASNAHIIIFDTNGEYKKAFQFLNKEIRARVNTFTIGKDGLKVPYWFMNYNDFDYLFTPSEQTQAPILKKAISLARIGEKSAEESASVLDEPIISKISQLRECLQKNDFTLFAFLKNRLADIIEATGKNDNQYVQAIHQILATSLATEAQKLSFNKMGYHCGGDIALTVIIEVIKVIDENLNQLLVETGGKGLSNDCDIDVPKYFSYQQLFVNCIDAAINEIGVSHSKYQEYLSSLRLRLSSYYSDERVSIPFMMRESEFPYALSSFLQYITGILTDSMGGNIFTNYRHNQDGKEFINVSQPNNISQVTILDMSLLPYEVLENMTGLIGRLIIEFLQRIEKVDEYKDKRGQFPVVLVLEEAQNYIPEINQNKDRVSISKRVFERIAREGRKYGLSLIISSQRPSELSKTVLSQCNTFIVHRLQNPEDQKYVRELVSSANEDILNQLPILPQQHAIIMGDAVRSPVQVRMFDTNPKPDSDDPNFFDNWINGKADDIDFEKVARRWLDKEE